ncbi:MAG: hypothetical protein WBN94_08840 [Methanothrix sp.]
MSPFSCDGLTGLSWCKMLLVDQTCAPLRPLSRKCTLARARW